MVSSQAKFSLVNSFTIKHVEVKEFISQRTGVKVFLLAYDTPIVNSYFVIPTQADNHEGLPHTLEHIIFLGSERYPYRGTLDILACRALSMGTNAWTATDHTAYTLSTAGLDGTLKMLPIYLDHILHPTLTEEAFMTDVHHITADGSNSGVVYCEMKSCENTAESIMHFEALDKLYPGDSGYKMNTGGRLDGIRSTNVDRVREFHKKFYRWDNLSIVICGNVFDESLILSTIEKTETESIEYHPQKKAKHDNDANKPWSELRHVQKLEQSVKSQVAFPSEEEDNGNYSLSWRGPAWDNFELIRAISLVGSYLVDSTTSPLERAMIHNGDPYGSCVDFSMDCFKEIYFQLVVKDVPFKDSDKMTTVEEKLCSSITDVYNSPLDMERLHMLIERGNMTYLRQIETSPHETLIESIIGYILYSESAQQLEQLLNSTEMVKRLLSKDESYWKDILETYFIDAPNVSIKCIPSTKLSTEIQEFEEELIRKQIEEHGLEKLNDNKTRVESMFENNNGPPKEVIEGFGFCNSSNISLPKWPLLRNFKSSDLVDGVGKGADASFNNVLIYNKDTGKGTIEDIDSLAQELNLIKYPIQVNHISSDFVKIYLLFSTIDLDLSLDEKRLLLILSILMFESNVSVDDKLVKAEDFIQMLMDNTTSYGSNLGLNSSSLLPDEYSGFISVYFTSPVENYEKILEIFFNIVYNIEYSSEIIKNHINSLLTSFSKKKRSAKCLVRQISTALRIKSDSVRNTCSLGQQNAFLKSVVDKDLVESLTALHKKVFRPENMCLHITADLSKLPVGWINFWKNLPCSSSIDKPLSDHFNFKYGTDKEFKSNSAILSSLASTDVTYFRITIPAPIGYDNPDYIALSVIAEYLSMVEGPLYRVIRGGGYAYNHAVVYFPSQGEIYLSIFQATDLIQALKATQDAICKILSPTSVPDDDIMAAKASLIFRVLSNEETLSEYSQETFLSALRQTSINHNKEVVDKIQEVSIEDIKVATEKYLKEFLTFDGPPKSISCITSRGSVDELFKGLNDINYTNICQLSPDSILPFLSNETEQI
ncbi:conserved hypothetical protein [Theileria equi strain WA]|uniref:Uncharacterized protein n=1 Tax=Theileria equi strain WA TaxID=1537102 RepID=L1LEF1_THEEQ|nr:conserved hypothetical protein [Theileria equi strain WA]EKX73787.1 conserved hypothetical protein [Theileria equi strain WA]|eukprot:XP_004833239.1 conserved hypothetical protein [Theileria equi strain WA]